MKIQTKGKNKNRKKRAIIGFIGELSKSIFGTATVSDDVKLLAQSSFISIANKRISNIVNEMKDAHDEKDLLQNVITQRNLKFFYYIQHNFKQYYSKYRNQTKIK